MLSSRLSVSVSATQPKARARAVVAAVVGWLLPVAVFGTVAARRWWQYGESVSGADPGNWFAFGRELFGEGGKSTPGAYPPLVPVLLHLGQTIADPMVVAKTIAVSSLLAIMFATYIAACHGMDRWFALGIATTVGLASSQSETIAFGGYPQNVALAALVLTAIALARYLAEGKRRHLLGMAAACATAALSHHMYFALTCVVAGLVWVVWVTTRPARRAIIQRTLCVGLAGMLAVACFLPTLLELQKDGYSPPINASGFHAMSALEYGIREAPVLWVVVFVLGGTFVALTANRRRAATWQIAAALMLSSVMLFPLTAEPRLIPLYMVGACLGTGLALEELWSRSHGSMWGGVPLAAAVVLPLILWPLADAKAAELFSYYRVADHSLVEAAAVVDQYHGDQVVVVRQSRRGWPIGWWFEGLTEARIAVGSSQKWLAFPEERDNAQLAGDFFDKKRTSAQVAALARQTGVGLLVFRKWEWIGWQDWLAEDDPAVDVIFDDGEFMVLAIDPH